MLQLIKILSEPWGKFQIEVQYFQFCFEPKTVFSLIAIPSRFNKRFLISFNENRLKNNHTESNSFLDL